MSMKTLIRTINSDKAELYVTIDGRRCTLAKCAARIETYEERLSIPGAKGVKKTHASLILCNEMDFTREPTDDLLRQITSYDLSVDVWRQDGIFERISLYRLDLEEIDDLEGEWTFSVGDMETLRKLMTM